jgi:hypothetical protein
LLGSSSSFAYASQIKTWTLSSLHLELSQIDWRSSYPIIQCVRNFIYSAYVFLICQSNLLLWWFVVFCSDGAYGYDHSGAEWEGVVSWHITCPCLCAPGNFCLPAVLPSIDCAFLCAAAGFDFFFLFWMCYAGFDYVKEESN